MRARHIVIGIVLLLVLAACSTSVDPPASSPPLPSQQAFEAIITFTPGPSPTATMVLPTQVPHGGIYAERENKVVFHSLETNEERSYEAHADTFQISPNGEMLGIVNDGELVVMRVEDGEQRAIGADVANEFAWGPRSDTITYVKGDRTKISEPAGNHCTPESELWTVDLEKQVSNKVGSGCDPAWAQTDREFAYVGYASPEARQNLFYVHRRLNPEPWNQIKQELNDPLFPAPRNAFHKPIWLITGQHVVVLASVQQPGETQYTTLELVDLVDVTVEPIGVLVDAIGHSVRASPNGERILYKVRSKNGVPTLATHILLTGRQYLWVSPWDQTKTAVLRDQTGAQVQHVYAGAWAPEGLHVVVIYCRDESQPNGVCKEGSKGEIRIMDPLSGELSPPVMKEVDLDGDIAWGVVYLTPSE